MNESAYKEFCLKYSIIAYYKENLLPDSIGFVMKSKVGIIVSFVLSIIKIKLKIQIY